MGYFRVAKTKRIGCLMFTGQFSTKEPYDYWPFCEKRPAILGVLCIFATLYHLLPLFLYMCVCVRVCVCACACVRACMCV